MVANALGSRRQWPVVLMSEEAKCSTDHTKSDTYSTWVDENTHWQETHLWLVSASDTGEEVTVSVSTTGSHRLSSHTLHSRSSRPAASSTFLPLISPWDRWDSEVNAFPLQKYASEVWERIDHLVMKRNEISAIDRTQAKKNKKKKGVRGSDCDKDVLVGNAVQEEGR